MCRPVCLLDDLRLDILSCFKVIDFASDFAAIRLRIKPGDLADRILAGDATLPHLGASDAASTDHACAGNYYTPCSCHKLSTSPGSNQLTIFLAAKEH